MQGSKSDGRQRNIKY